MQVRPVIIGLAGAGLMLASCGPVPVAQAENICLKRVEDARPVSGVAGLGVADGKPATRLDLDVNVSTDTFRDPSKIYQSCVYQYSGEMPRRPLYDR